MTPPLTPQALATILSKLDPDKVSWAIHDRRMATKDGWYRCFLALYYGEPGKLETQMDQLGRRAPDSCVSRAIDRAGEVVGLTAVDVDNVIHWYDLHPRTFKRLVRLWLEEDPQRKAKLSVVTAHSR